MALSRSSKWFLAVTVVGVIAVGAAVLLLTDRIGDSGGEEVEPGQPVAIDVSSGASLRAVADEMVERGVIERTNAFLEAAGDTDLDQQLQPGGYDLETGMSDEEVVDAMLEGPDRANSVRFTIPEGLAVELIIERLGEAFEEYEADDFRAVLDERTEAGGNAEDVLAIPEWAPEPAEAGDEVIEPYEGLFFPETYEVSLDATPLDVLQRMVSQTETVMERSIAEAGAEEADPYRVLIKASLVERETRVDEERARVAGVIENRIDEGMRLQIDATVLYARGEHTEVVLLEDLDIDSPYNTYDVDGLPPAPIAAPGEAAIRATLEPEDHDYLYYVLAPACDGSHQFAEDEQGHQQNVAEFRDADRCQ